ncbi:unnamed protein product [Cladocopium goreaui]|uniref:General transcription and DNA repair factor IIH helicase subunit XPD (TFIIH subunit XPD) (ERCC2 homolog ) (RAD3 homolog) (UV hypersensitive protein 6) (AtUVH6) (XPD homolog) (AtXPD) n=1 Tax=Cladocopium goreaui TaxID=2562237 RepID=A0A9P1CHP1_9DINO|nr:unnamed protein product [Cladocopium goreaui]
MVQGSSFKCILRAKQQLHHCCSNIVDFGIGVQRQKWKRHVTLVKVAEGIDFDRHYGRCVVLFGVPFQYTLSRELRARLEFLRQHYDIKESEFLNFDAMRQASQCLGRVIRSKRDYGVMIFADQRYARSDKRSKIPDWIRHFLEPGHVFMATDLAVEAAGNFLLQMSQPYEEKKGIGASVLTPEALKDDLWADQRMTCVANPTETMRDTKQTNHDM